MSKNRVGCVVAEVVVLVVAVKFVGRSRTVTLEEVLSPILASSAILWIRRSLFASDWIKLRNAALEAANATAAAAESAPVPLISKAR